MMEKHFVSNHDNANERPWTLLTVRVRRWASCGRGGPCEADGEVGGGGGGRWA
jgi:hypothetical protein